MRSGGNFSPERGYLAPAPSFARTARVVLVATAIGATAGAGVVLALVERPSEPEKSPVAARAIVTSVRAAAVPSVAPAAPAPAMATGPAKPASPPASVAAAPSSDKPDISARVSARTTPVAPMPAPSAAALPNTAAPAAAQTTSVPPTAAGSAGSTTTVPASTPASASAAAASPEGQPANVVGAAPPDTPESAALAAPEQAAPPQKGEASHRVQQKRSICRNRFGFPADVRLSRCPVLLSEFPVRPRSIEPTRSPSRNDDPASCALTAWACEQRRSAP